MRARLGVVRRSVDDRPNRRQSGGGSCMRVSEAPGVSIVVFAGGWKSNWMVLDVLLVHVAVWSRMKGDVAATRLGPDF